MLISLLDKFGTIVVCMLPQDGADTPLRGVSISLPGWSRSIKPRLPYSDRIIPHLVLIYSTI